jgi:predicted nucleic acid-binding protein
VILYLDTSAVAKLVVEEAESAALTQFLDDRSAAPGSAIGR